jgi:hypothetical protein
MDAIAKRIAGFIPANNLDRERDNYFVSAPFTFDRHQVDSRVDYNVNSKLNLIGTFGVLHYRSSTPTVFGDTAVGRPIGGSSNPGLGHGNTYRVTVMGTYTFSPTFLVDAHYGWARQGTASEQPGLGTNIGTDVLGIPGTNGPRAFESGWPSFVFEDFATVGVNENFMPYYRHDPQSQYVVNFNWMKRQHNIRFGGEPGAGRVPHRRFRRAGRIRVRQRDHPAVRGGQSGDGQLRADLAQLAIQQPCRVPDRPGEQRRQNAAGSRRVPRACVVDQRVRTRPLVADEPADDRLRHTLGVLPGSDPARSRHRALRCRNRQGVALRCRLGPG